MNKALLHQLLRMRSYIGSDSFRRYLYANEDGMSHGEFFDAVAAAIAQQEPQTKPVVDQNQANVIDKALLQRSLAMIQSGTYPLTQAASREFLIDDLIAAMAQQEAAPPATHLFVDWIGSIDKSSYSPDALALEAFCAGYAQRGSGEPAQQPEPVAWRYVPSPVYPDLVYTHDPERVALCREHGIELTPLYTAPKAQPLRDLTYAEVEAIAAKHLKAFAQSVGAGDVWHEGEFEFAEAIIKAAQGKA